MMNDQRTLKALGYLYKIVEAGEKGYAVCAANIDNPGLKILFKSYAQQRGQFKAEILAEIKRMGAAIQLRSSIRGAIHRGRIDIFAALTIGKKEREVVILKEITLGEKAALRGYERTLRVELSGQARQIVTRQYEVVRAVMEQIQLIQARTGKRMLVQLFEQKADVMQALKVLEESNTRPTSIEQIDIQKSLKHYHSRGNAAREAALSGAIGGAFWGCVIGALAGISSDFVANADQLGAAQPAALWMYIALAGLVGGAFIGMFIGFVIGAGISEEDSYQYNHTMQQGQILMLITLETSQISEVERIIAQIRPRQFSV
jgi:uncharacterized protein (TIGR02284 family)